MAPLAAVDAIEAAATLPFDEGCRRERELFVECMRPTSARRSSTRSSPSAPSRRCRTFRRTSPPCRSPPSPSSAPARWAAASRWRAPTPASGRAADGRQHRSARARASPRFAGTTSRRVKRGRFTAEVAERVGRIQRAGRATTASRRADLVIEAVFENLALKKQVFAEIDAIAKPGCDSGDQHVHARASTRSRRRPTRPASVIGLHFFSPANVMRLVEIVRGRATSTDVIATALAFAKRLEQGRRRRRQRSRASSATG